MRTNDLPTNNNTMKDIGKIVKLIPVQKMNSAKEINFGSSSIVKRTDHNYKNKISEVEYLILTNNLTQYLTKNLN